VDRPGDRPRGHVQLTLTGRQPMTSGQANVPPAHCGAVTCSNSTKVTIYNCRIRVAFTAMTVPLHVLVSYGQPVSQPSPDRPVG
jgi:hypothetical protein